MLDSSRHLGAPLPKNWPRRVRSAVVHAISMSNVVFAVTRSHAENHFNARVRIQAENDRLRREVSLLTEELRIKDSRMERIPPQRRPHYPPVERLAILELRAARSWSLAQTARRMLVTPLTVASWSRRLDDEGAVALVQLSEPVNRFPEFVRYLVRRLKVHSPAFGSRRIARVLARAGLHLGATTVRRMLRPSTKPLSASTRKPTLRVVTAQHPNHVWHADLSAPCRGP
jgi:transcriptional regulator with XRE-family HTH domain